ncbi:hypothetical protein SCUCBS95973_000512 [Sporothrix curviconia]|uniref:SMP domain-containing protein n=1 Tax=Sporothrix curviconia TaxID=1260050 RepID=A0ABP0AQW4_9PEZI
MDNKSAQTSQPHADGSKPNEIHRSAGSDALRKAYAKYNIHATTPSAGGHEVSTDQAAQATDAAAKDSKGAENETK